MLGNLMTILMTGLLALGFLVLAPVASAAWAGQSFLSRLRPSRWELGQRFRGSIGVLLVAAAVFLLVAGIGAATSYLRDSDDASRAPHSNRDTLSALKDYSSTIRAEEPKHAATGGKQLPDVNTMIERLAARLETTPGDLKGWRMLGWSYYYTGRYKEAVAAYAKAVALDPNSEELKTAYEEVKAKASESANTLPPSPPHSKTDAKEEAGPSAEDVARMQAMPAEDRAAAIRSMVDGLANRLESSPRDVDGWSRLMRSRIVLGEKDVAEKALRKALDVFKDDTAASERIKAAAIGLGLKVE
jgi:cytochrome c-type biogenesis protein CcmH